MSGRAINPVEDKDPIMWSIFNRSYLERDMGDSSESSPRGGFFVEKSKNKLKIKMAANNNLENNKLFWNWAVGLGIIIFLAGTYFLNDIRIPIVIIVVGYVLTMNISMKRREEEAKGIKHSAKTETLWMLHLLLGVPFWIWVLAMLIK